MHHSSRIPAPALLVITSLVITCLISSCRAIPTPTATPTPIPTVKTTSTPFPTSTPTPEPLASDKNPLILAVVSENNDPEVQTAADDIAFQINQITGFKILARVYSSYPLLLSDMAVARVHIAFLPPLTFLYARQEGFAQAALVANHLGVYSYGTRFYANVSSKLTSYYDPTSDRITADAAIALKQLQDKRPCWVDSNSPSGYVAPLGMLAEQKLTPRPGAFLGAPTSVIRALYITGICDFGVTFSTTGDPRTAEAVQQDLSDVMDRIIILWQSDPIIPNLNLSLHPSLKSDLREDLAFAVQALPKSSEGKNALLAALNYEILDFKPISDSTYDSLLRLANLANIELSTTVGK